MIPIGFFPYCGFDNSDVSLAYVHPISAISRAQRLWIR